MVVRDSPNDMGDSKVDQDLMDIDPL